MSPNFAEASYAVALVQRRLGRWQDSLASFQAAALIEPANPEYITEIGTLLLAGRRYAEAEVALRRAESLGRTGGGPRALKATLALHSRGEVLPESALVELNGLTRRFFGSIHDELPTKSPAADAALDRAFVLAARGEKDAARTELDDPSKTLRKRLEVGQSNFFGWSDLAMMEALRGNREEALRCARTFSENPRVAKDAWYGANCMATLVYVQAWTGDLAGACDELARLLQTPVYPTGAAINVYSLRLHPAFFPLRGDPRFEALLNDPKNNAPLF
jgi:tetratricopeptide (TPR) repeat protein